MLMNYKSLQIGRQLCNMLKALMHMDCMVTPRLQHIQLEANFTSARVVSPVGSANAQNIGSRSRQDILDYSALVIDLSCGCTGLSSELVSLFWLVAACPLFNIKVTYNTLQIRSRLPPPVCWDHGCSHVQFRHHNQRVAN